MPGSVMLFAAGFGTRMGDLTKDRPKPLVDVAGKPLIEHAMDLVRAVHPDRIVANAHYKAHQIVDHFAGTEVLVNVELPDILDTGGGLKAALPMLESDVVFTMNTDAVWDGPNPLSLLQSVWTDDMQALLLCVPKSQVIGHTGSGDLDVSKEGYGSWGTETVYSGVQLIRTNCVSDTPENVFSLKSVWEKLESQGALRAITYPGRWCDVGHPGGIALAEKMLGFDNV